MRKAQTAAPRSFSASVVREVSESPTLSFSSHSEHLLSPKRLLLCAWNRFDTSWCWVHTLLEEVQSPGKLLMCPIYKSSQAVHLTDTPSMSNCVGWCLNSLPFFDNYFYLSSFYLLLSPLLNHAFNVKGLFPRFWFHIIPLAASRNIRCWRGWGYPSLVHHPTSTENGVILHLERQCNFNNQGGWWPSTAVSGSG